MGVEAQSYPLSPPDVLGSVIDPDLEPMYKLEEREYIRIINRLSNLILVSVQMLQTTGVVEPARMIAKRASHILADYDPDVAEVVRSVVAPSPALEEEGEG